MSPTRQSTRSPAASMSTTTTAAASLGSTPSKAHQHHHHHHLPVGHSIHSPAHSATGEAIQGRPSEAGGLHTPTSRGNILVPPSASATSVANTPADLLSVLSSTASNASLSSRPGSPAVLSAPNSPVLLRSSRPTTPCRSPVPRHQQDLETMSNSTTPQLDSSAIFERDAEFATEHLLTGSEAIDLAAAPVLSEVALAVASNDPSPASSGFIGGAGGTAPPHHNLTQSLDSTLFSSPAAQLPSNAVFRDADQDVGGATTYNESHTMSLSERLRHSSSSPSGAIAAGATNNATATAASDGTGGEDFSPPPSLSLSPSATGSPISSAPGSPVQSLHYPASSLIGNGTAFGAGSGAFGHNLSDGGAPVMGLDVGGGSAAGLATGAMPSSPGSAMSGVSFSDNKDSSKRRLSMISYADIINSERLSDTHSGFSSPTPSSALSLSAAALPVQSGSNAGLSPAVSPGLAGIGATGAAATGGVNSALYSPVTSPEGDGALSPSALSDVDAREGTVNRKPLEEKVDLAASPIYNKPPANNRTDTMSSTGTERYAMPGAIPLQTPPLSQSNEREDQDVTPTHSKTEKQEERDGITPSSITNPPGELKESTSNSSWNMLEMGKALVGNAAGAVGSVLGVSGIGTELDNEDTDDKVKK